MSTADLGDPDQERSLLDADDEVFCEDTEHNVVQFLSAGKITPQSIKSAIALYLLRLIACDSCQSVTFVVIGLVIPLGFARVLWKKSRANVEVSPPSQSFVGSIKRRMAWINQAPEKLF